MADTINEYDVFICYRRQGGATEARLIQAKLTQFGLRVFLDVDELRPGHYDEALLDCIARTPNFIVILSVGSLARCLDENDWLRQEIAQALKTGRKIIPIMMPGFAFPEPQRMPEEIRSLATHQSISYSHEFFDAMMTKLLQYLRHRPAAAPTSSSAPTDSPAIQPPQFAPTNGATAEQPATTAGQPLAEDFLTIDSTPFLNEKGKIWHEPTYETQAVKSLLDILWAKLRPYLPAHTYGNVWVLRNRETGEVFWDLTTDLPAYHGLGRVAQTLKEAGILPGMTLEIVPLIKERPPTE